MKLFHPSNKIYFISIGISISLLFGGIIIYPYKKKIFNLIGFENEEEREIRLQKDKLLKYKKVITKQTKALNKRRLDFDELCRLKIKYDKISESKNNENNENDEDKNVSAYYHFDSSGKKYKNKWDEYDVDEELKKLDGSNNNNNNNNNNRNKEEIESKKKYFEKKSKFSMKLSKLSAALDKTIADIDQLRIDPSLRDEKKKLSTKLIDLMHEVDILIVDYKKKLLINFIK